MTRTTELLDRFNRSASLRNAKALVQHVDRHSAVLSLLNEDQEGTVRNALRIIAAASRK